MFDNVITSYNALIPIVYYYYRCDGLEIRKKIANDKTKFNIIRVKRHTITDDEKKAILYYLELSIINSVFGSSTDETLNSIKCELDKLIDRNRRINKKWIKTTLSKGIG